MVREHPLEFAGQSITDKLKEVRQRMKEQDADVLVVTMLDEIAWLFNIRGSDVPYSPVILSYVAITQDGATLFIDSTKVPVPVRTRLAEAGVFLQPYTSLPSFLLESLSRGGKRVWLDGKTCNFAIYSRIPAAQRIDQPSPIALLKARKNPAELAGMRACHLRDGAAVVEFLAWLELQFNSGGGGDGDNNSGGSACGSTQQVGISEVTLADKLQSFRAQCGRFLEPSFATIAGVNENGAIIHYRAREGRCKVLTAQDLLLLDSGAQYVDGTTDVTRTLHMGTPTAYQKEMFTRVLKGHIALDKQCFPPGTAGCLLDTLARQHLWQAGRNYLHGTGRGVGAALNVHEGPQRISSVLNPQPLLPGMIVSNEPGYYEPGKFGIRIENLLEVVEEANGYLGFRRLTHIPMQVKMMDLALLTVAEREWVDGYHREVREKVGPLLRSAQAREWLQRNTQPINVQQQCQRL